MTKLEEIFDEAAKRNMLQWDLEKFKQEYPRLYRSIMESLKKVKIENETK